MKRWTILKGILATLGMTCSLGSPVCYGNSVTVTLNTSALMGRVYGLAFNLIDGDATINNTLIVRNVQLGGGALAGGPLLTGGASGSLSDTGTLADTTFFSQILQDFSPGKMLSFDLDFTNNFAGGTPDSLAFLIIDNSTGLPIPTLDPLGTDVFLALDLDSATPMIPTFGADPSRTGLDIGPPTVSTAPPAPVPEPSSWQLLGIGLGSVVFLRWRRRDRDHKQVL